MNGPNQQQVKGYGIGTEMPSAVRPGVVRSILRAIGLFMVLFVTINFVSEMLRPGFDLTLLCMPLTPVRWHGSRILVTAATLLLGWSLLRPLRDALFYVATQAILGLLFLSALKSALGTRFEFFQDEISLTLTAPYLICVMAAHLSQILRIRSDHRLALSDSASRYTGAGMVTTILALITVALCFMAAQVFLFGSDEPLPADCIVVMGAGVTHDGSPGPVLLDRIHTACVLHQQDLADGIIFSGGPASDDWSEPKSMERYAQDTMSVPYSDMVLDEQGVSTYHTALNVRSLMAEREWRTAIVVTHDYHLSRTWCAFQRAGIRAQIAPAKRSNVRFWKETYAMSRECAAWPYYFFRPLWNPFPDS